MEKIKEHKIKIIIAILVLILSVFLIVRIFAKGKETTDVNKYQQHLVVSNSNSERYKFNLLVYLDSIGIRLVDCDEDVAEKLREFSAKFKDEASNLNGFIYVGEDVVEGSELYFELSDLYIEMASNLESIADAIDNKDKEKVIFYFDLLQENLTEIEDKN